MRIVPAPDQASPVMTYEPLFGSCCVAGGIGDYRLGTEVVIEPLRFFAEQESRVLLKRQVGLVDDLDASQPLDVVDALEARHDEAQREAVVRTHRLAILRVGHDHIVQRLGQRYALGVLAVFGALGEDPFRLVLEARPL